MASTTVTCVPGECVKTRIGKYTSYMCSRQVYKNPDWQAHQLHVYQAGVQKPGLVSTTVTCVQKPGLACTSVTCVPGGCTKTRIGMYNCYMCTRKVYKNPDGQAQHLHEYQAGVQKPGLASTAVTCVQNPGLASTPVTCVPGKCTKTRIGRYNCYMCTV
jgi:hypothetical protein